MSKPVGKVLDSKVGKGMVKVGNAMMAPFKWAGGQIEKQMRMEKKQDDKWRDEGAAMNRSYSGLPSNVKYRK